MPTLLEFETNRLCLRQWRATDRAPFAALNADSRVMRNFPSPLSRAESDALADRCASWIAARGWGFWAVETKATGAFIGFVGLHVPSDALPFSPCVEIGWRLAFEHWGKGFAYEAAQGALDVAFQNLGLDAMVSFTAVGNARSRAVMERLGMSASGTFQHPLLPEHHPLRLHCLYRLARSDTVLREDLLVPHGF